MLFNIHLLCTYWWLLIQEMVDTTSKSLIYFNLSNILNSIMHHETSKGPPKTRYLSHLIGSDIFSTVDYFILGLSMELLYHIIWYSHLLHYILETGLLYKCLNCIWRLINNQYIHWHAILCSQRRRLRPRPEGRRRARAWGRFQAGRGRSRYVRPFRRRPPRAPQPGWRVYSW